MESAGWEEDGLCGCARDRQGKKILWATDRVRQLGWGQDTNVSEGALALPGDSWCWASPQPWQCHLCCCGGSAGVSYLCVSWLAQDSAVPCSGFLSVRADYSAKAAMWQSCLHCFTELGCLLSPSIIFRAGNRILMVEVQIKFSCWTLGAGSAWDLLTSQGTRSLCKESSPVLRVGMYMSAPKLIANAGERPNAAGKEFLWWCKQNWSDNVTDLH